MTSAPLWQSQRCGPLRSWSNSEIVCVIAGVLAAYFSEEDFARAAVIARCRNEERSGACEVAAKGRQHAMTASLKKGGAKSLSF